MSIGPREQKRHRSAPPLSGASRYSSSDWNDVTRPCLSSETSGTKCESRCGLKKSPGPYRKNRNTEFRPTGVQPGLDCFSNAFTGCIDAETASLAHSLSANFCESITHLPEMLMTLLLLVRPLRPPSWIVSSVDS